MKVAIYLRKSRADEELEKTLGQGETLKRHKKTLLEYAKKQQFDIAEIKEEIVSGESLFNRPKMLELLKEVEAEKYDGVLVMDMQRLGRGDMKDQGIILETFKNSNTKIITPQKTYDLNNEFDEDYSEFEAFMGRKEYKMIKKRMQTGRIRSIKDGNYISPNPPFGYDIVTVGRNRILKSNKDAEIVKLIFDMYIKGNGTGAIAQRLNDLGYKSATGKDFERSTISFILKNPVYIGKITWRKKDIKKSRDPNKVKDTKTRDRSEWIIADGKHAPIIDEDTFNKAQEIIKDKYHIPYQIVNGARNPLAGLIICGVCGAKMVYRPYKGKMAHIICPKCCGNKSSRFDFIENDVLNALEDYLKEQQLESDEEIQLTSKDNVNIYKKQLENLRKKSATLNSQKLKLFDLLEQGIYTNEIFAERSNNINERMGNIEKEMNKVISLIESQNKKVDNKYNLKVTNVIAKYKKSKNVVEKNELMKSILIKIEYKKLKSQRGDDFEITLFPRL